MHVGINVDFAWQSACAAAEAMPTVTIGGADFFTNGSYVQDSSVLPARNGRPPAYCRTDKSNICLYLDEEGRWRVAYKRQAVGLMGGNAGFLRSEEVAPGTLPGSARGWEKFTAEGWVELPDVKVTGATYDTPDVVLILNCLPPRADGLAEISCMNMAGVEFASVSCEAEAQLLSEFRTHLAATLRFPNRKLRLLLNDGRLLSDAEDDYSVASVLNGCSSDSKPEECESHQVNFFHQADILDEAESFLDGQYDQLKLCAEPLPSQILEVSHMVATY